MGCAQFRTDGGDPPRQKRGRDASALRQTRLVERLRRAREPLALVTAPAGYGKTALLEQWRRSDERPFAWVSMEAADRDEAVLLDRVVRALITAGVLEPGPAEDVTPVPAQWTAVALAPLRRVLLERQRPFVLVMDDVPRDPPELLWGLLWIVQSLPNVRMVLASEDVPTPPANVVSAGPVHRIQVGDLTLTDAECRELLQTAGVQLAPTAADVVLRQIAGWPIALSVASVLLRLRPDVAGELGGREGLELLEFLVSELLAEAADGTRRFLTRTSVLGVLTGQLCDAVLETTGSAARLAEVAAGNLFFEPIQQRPGSYRYHVLLGRILQAELADAEPALVPELHRRASDWCRRKEDPEGTIRHARAADDLRRASSAMWHWLLKLLPLGRGATVERWLSLFTREEISTEPRMALSAGWCAVQAGQPLEPWLDMVEAALDVSDDAQSLRSEVALLRASLGAGGFRQMAADAELAYRLDSPDSVLRTGACMFAGVAYDMLGDSARARVWLEEGIRISVLLHAPSPHAQCLAQLAIITFAEGDWVQVERQAHAAMAEISRHRLADTAAYLAPVFIVAALVSAHHNKVTAARAQIQQALRLLAMPRHVMPWLAVQARVTLARAQLMIGDVDAARVMLREARDEIGRFSEATTLKERLDAATRLARELRTPAATGAFALTTHETQVLQYLPSHLSFEEIGRRLDMSGRAAKSRAVAVYRKLGVVSRSEAVERALVLGLIWFQDRPAGRLTDQ